MGWESKTDKLPKGMCQRSAAELHSIQFYFRKSPVIVDSNRLVEEFGRFRWNIQKFLVSLINKTKAKLRASVCENHSINIRHARCFLILCLEKCTMILSLRKFDDVKMFLLLFSKSGGTVNKIGGWGNNNK